MTVETRLTESELERYRRQMTLTGLTEKHQKTLKSSTAMVAGIGGLGGTAAIYLAVAGIGKMVFVHSGNLTLSNMNRQILMKHDWIGRSRVLQARRTIHEINPDVEVEIFDDRITVESVNDFLENAQVALSARPNFSERRILNKACVDNKVLMVEAAMNGMEGCLFSVVPYETPCLQCVFPKDDPDWKELGFPVLGAVSGMLGCIMAIEAIKLLTGYGKPMLSHMLLFNTTDMEFRKVNIRRDEQCPVCGKGRISSEWDCVGVTGNRRKPLAGGRR